MSNLSSKDKGGEKVELNGARDGVRKHDKKQVTIGDPLKAAKRVKKKLKKGQQAHAAKTETKEKKQKSISGGDAGIEAKVHRKKEKKQAQDTNNSGLQGPVKALQEATIDPVAMKKSKNSKTGRANAEVKQSEKDHIHSQQQPGTTLSGNEKDKKKKGKKRITDDCETVEPAAVHEQSEKSKKEAKSVAATAAQEEKEGGGKLGKEKSKKKKRKILSDPKLAAAHSKTGDDTQGAAATEAEAKTKGAASPLKVEEPARKRQEGTGRDEEHQETSFGDKQGTAAKAFQRVKADEWLGKKGSWDNSYVGTFGENGWGFKAQQILGQVRGKDFRHEKTKKKRGSYKGGLIDTGTVCSYKFESDDE